MFRDLITQKLEGRQLKPTDVMKSEGLSNLEGKKIGRYEGRLLSINSLSSYLPILLPSTNHSGGNAMLIPPYGLPCNDGTNIPSLEGRGRKGVGESKPFPLHPSLKKKPASTLAEGATHVAHFDNVRRVAFTLAEVLITLGIIGVVAALTLPSLIQEKQHKQLEAQFKKGYSAIQQAVLRASLEHSDLGSLYNEDFNTNRVTESGGEYIYEVLGKQFAGATTAKVAPSEVLNRIKTYNNNVLNTSNVTAATALDGGYISLPGQMDIFFETVLDLYITIDINGGKGPNKLGYDIFTFVLGENDKLIPLGSPEANKYKFGVQGSPSDMSNLDVTCNINSNSNFNGYGCAYPATIDPNYFKNLP